MTPRTTSHCVLALALLAALFAGSAPASAGEPDSATTEALRKAAAGDHRSAEDKARDRFRHPVETLAFFGLRDDMTVVELSPGGGWYTDILAPFLRERGKLYAAGYDPASETEYFRESAKRFAAKLAAKPELYDKVTITVLQPPDKLAIAPEGSANLVLTFRNLHNWIESGDVKAVLAAIHRTLAPGGVLGVVAHRGDSSVPQDPKAASGYVNQDYAIALIEGAGFQLVASSEINANPADTRNHPEGVWTLPPTFELGDKDREKYRAIGESDRMTLKFVKLEKP
ncbi:MAG TPA: methyltransferase [Myxococcota bacterium]